MERQIVFTQTDAEKIALFRSLFRGLTHVYGMYNPESGCQFQVKRPVTEQVIFDHLCGKHHFGVYLLNGRCTAATVADFDDPEPFPVFEFTSAAKHYGLETYVEVSKSKGFHVWIFFDSAGIPAAKARIVMKHILSEIEAPDVEIFPKQDQLNGLVTSGNYILAPLFGQLVPHGKTVFVDPATLAPYPDQWRFLSGIKRVPESVLDDIIALNTLDQAAPATSNTSDSDSSTRNIFGLPPCAQRMLANGVEEFQRVSCFRLAVHLKRIGFPQKMAVDVLKRWALQNKPRGKKRRITEKEIVDQIFYAYSKSYLSYGRQSEAVTRFCNETCWLKRGRNSPLTQ